MGQSMNIGPMGTGSVIFKRKFRWQLTLNFTCGGKSYGFTSFNVATGGRPKINIDTTEVHYLGAKWKIPGEEVDYEPLQFTFYDLIGVDLSSLYLWIAAYERTKRPRDAFTPVCQNGIITIEMLSGCGETIESWVLEGCWPSEVDFGDLDMSSSDVVMIALTVVYNLATLNNEYCTPTPSCTPCNTFAGNISMSVDHCPLYEGDATIVTINVTGLTGSDDHITITATAEDQATNLITVSSQDVVLTGVFGNYSLDTAIALPVNCTNGLVCVGSFNGVDELLECSVLPRPTTALCCSC